MTEHTRTAHVLVSHTDDALDVARTKLEHLATRDGYRITSEPRIIGAQQHAGATLDHYEADAEPADARLTDSRFDICASCEHYRSEHDLVDGSCTCDVLVSLALSASRWERCTCSAYTEPAS